ncbi:MAG: hypothetical protein H7301_09260 [Cryobacterium sp.]|nr:hypothetical protein [Oligoflexia bacterium]
MKRSLTLFCIALFVFPNCPAFAFDGEGARANTVCSEGRQSFGKLECRTAEEKKSPLVEAYFFGAESLEEVMHTFPDRFEKIRSKCERVAFSHRPEFDADLLQVSVKPIEVCVVKRGEGDPCLSNADCLENLCHPDRGSCAPAFTVPLTATQ